MTKTEELKALYLRLKKSVKTNLKMAAAKDGVSQEELAEQYIEDGLNKRKKSKQND